MWRARSGVVLLCLVIFSLVASNLSGNVIYVDASATGTNDGSNWENAYVELQSALATAVSGVQIRVVEEEERLPLFLMIITLIFLIAFF